jgi:hypothetical protein
MYLLSCKALTVVAFSVLTLTSLEAATFQVTNIDDAGPGSLRQALIDADANNEADTIDLASIAGQTIVLTSGELRIELDQIEILGAGVTIDAQQNSRVFNIGGSIVFLNDLIITGGNALSEDGGGIRAGKAALVINGCEIAFNQAASGGGVSAGGVQLFVMANSHVHSNTSSQGGGLAIGLADSIVIEDSIINDNRADLAPPEPDVDINLIAEGISLDGEGGGLWVRSANRVEIARSSIISNTALEGGGILALSEGGQIQIEQSTISDNVAQTGGGVLAAAGESRVSNSTISGNQSVGSIGGIGLGAVVPGPSNSATVEFTTIVNNTAGTESGGILLTAQNSASAVVGSVISSNTAPIDPDLTVIEGTSPSPVEVRRTLIGIDPVAGTLNKDPASIALTGQSPQLAPLGSFGGPTSTHIPFSGSPLLDGVPNGEQGCGLTLLEDQRGEPRPQNGACDIGSVEGSMSAQPMVVPVPILDRIGLLMMVALIGLVGLLALPRRRQSSVS